MAKARRAASPHGTLVAVTLRLPVRSLAHPTTAPAFACCLAVVCAAPSALAQRADAGTTGVYLSAGATLSGFGFDALTFREQGRHGGTSDGFTGKQVQLGRAWLPGVSFSAHVDHRWFYVRVGADLYLDPTPGVPDFSIRSTTFGWIAAGPRFVFGAFALQGGLRVGALLVDAERRAPDMAGTASDRPQQYSGLGAVYAVDIGAQWRPSRWFQLDVSAGQDLLGPLTATTFALTASVGWSRASQR